MQNATQAVDNMLKGDTQSEAIKQVTTALGIDTTAPMTNSSQSVKRDEFLKNATSAIEGLINLKAAEMVQKKEVAKQI